MLLPDALMALDLPPDIAARVSFDGSDRLPSCFAVTELASASIAAACLAVSELVACISAAPDISVNNRLASLWFGMTIQPQGWALSAAWDTLAGDYQARDGWIKLHTNAPHHRAAVLSVLGCAPTREAVVETVARWDSDRLEQDVVQAGGCAARLRSRAEWRDHPQGKAVNLEPLIVTDDSASPVPMATSWQPSAIRPLAGLRVLDLTRVLAGPVATRFLAGYGAEVLRIDPPGWDEPGVVPEVTPGKRCARLDLRDPMSRNVFERLLAGADILVHGYRPDALDRLGYDAATRRAIRPGLVDVSLDAYGQTGPWHLRRGFDSLVQFSTGIADAGRQWRKTAAPVSLPVQALDHATGYLMAAAAVRGILARQRGEACPRYRLSLARTAEWLWSAGTSSSESRFSEPMATDFCAVAEQTHWGKAFRILPPASIAGSPMQWSRPAGPLGSAAAEWQ
ncbi:MAG: CoA transferase [Novosphingobium sp.]|nr:CoA transferase [Novosphingobium sp.]